MLKLLAIAAICSAVVLFASLVGMLALYSSQHSEPYDQEQPSESESPQSQDRNPAANPTANNSNKESHQEWYYGFVDRPTDWLLVLFNGLLVLATIALFISGERAVGVARISASAAKESAIAAKQSATTADEVGRAQTRAYVSIKSAKLVFIGPEANPFTTIVVSNGGRSPARNFLWEVSLQYYYNGNILIQGIANKEWLNKIGIDISANSEEEPESKLTLNMGFIKYVADVKPPLPHAVVRIKIEFRYTDVFGENVFGEAYYSALVQREQTALPPQTAGIPGWEYRIFPVPRPDDWNLLNQKHE
jgi:hypothetical protein